MKVTLIIPTFNEREGIEWLLPQLKDEWFDKLIIVDGGSTDGTMQSLQGLNRFTKPCITITQKEPGLPMAYIEALEWTDDDIVIMISPDGNSIPELIPKLVAKIEEGYDMVTASRYMGGAKSVDDDCITACGNFLFSAIINYLFHANYTDAFVMYRGYRRSAISSMAILSLSAGYSWEIMACIRAEQLGLRVADIPGDEPKRIAGKRKLRVFKHGWMALVQIMREYFK